MVKTLAVVVALNRGQPAVNLVRSMSLVDSSLRILRTEQGLCIPLSRPIDESESARLSAALGPIRIEEREFSIIVERPRTLVQALEGHLPPHLLPVVPRSFDIIGRVAIVELPDELARFGDLVGKAVLKTCPSVRTVMAKAGVFSSEYRTRELRLIAGEDNTVTCYREHGCVFELDVRTVFFSPRLGYERLRVASQVEPGETVVDMFAGVGPYSILVAKKQPLSSVYAVDANPSAFKFLVSNILANRVLGSVRPMMGDVREVVRSSLSRTADRVIMNLPGSALDFVGDACLGLRERGGIIHFYSFESGKNPREGASMKLREKVEASGRELNSIMTARTVKEIAPYRVQVAVDALVK
jgi:tRNA (guanine37-N1)-methyltransferase